MSATLALPSGLLPSARPNAQPSVERVVRPLTCKNLAQRIGPLRGGDRSHAIDVEAIIDRALAEVSTLQRVFRHREFGAFARIDAQRLKSVLIALVCDVVETTAASGPCAGAIEARTIMIRDRSIVVELADLRRLWNAIDPAQLGDPRELYTPGAQLARTADAVSGIVVCAEAQTGLGRLVWIEIPQR